MWRRYKEKLTLYLAMPEMRVFWVFLTLVFVVAIVNFFSLHIFWAVFNAVILTGVGAAVFLSSLRTAAANLAMRLEHEELQGIVSNLSDAVIAYDQDFKILVFNAAAERVFNVKADEVLGKSFTLELKDDPKARKFRVLLMVLFPALAPIIVRRSDPSESLQVLDISLSDPPVELRITTSRIIDADGQTLGSVKVVHDRTRELEMLRSKSEFIAVASHQLRAPLTALSWAFEELSKESDEVARNELIVAATQATKHLLKIVDDLLDVARIEEGRFGYQFQEVNIVSFLEGALAQATLVARQYNIRVYFDRPKEDAIQVMIDPQKLGAALSNLIDNAIKYNTRNGELILKVERMPNKPYLKISVHDTGIGIPPEVIDRLFTKFFRSENAMKTATEGTGLGLYITKNIINRHGGEIWAESVLDRGSTFFFTLPLDFSLIPAKELVYEE